MRNFNVVKVDAKGRILIPFHLRQYLGLEKESEILIVNNGAKELKLFPLVEGRSAEIKLQIKDVPGSLAKAMDILAKNKVDILMSQSKTIERGSLAEWNAIVDISECDDLDALEKELHRLNCVKVVEVVKK